MTPGDRVKILPPVKRYAGRLGTVVRLADVDYIVAVDDVGERWFRAGELEVAPLRLRRAG